MAIHFNHAHTCTRSHVDNQRAFCLSEKYLRSLEAPLVQNSSWRGKSNASLYLSSLLLPCEWWGRKFEQPVKKRDHTGNKCSWSWNEINRSKYQIFLHYTPVSIVYNSIIIRPFLYQQYVSLCRMLLVTTICQVVCRLFCLKLKPV